MLRQRQEMCNNSPATRQNVKYVVLHQNYVPGNLGITQHTCTVAERRSPRAQTAVCSLKASTRPSVQHTQNAYIAVIMREKSFITGDKKIHHFIFLSLCFKCDCCRKELGTTMPCSVLVAFKGIARRAWGRPLAARGWWAQTS